VLASDLQGDTASRTVGTRASSPDDSADAGSGGELWRSFPEATQSDILGLLVMLLERLAVTLGLAAERTGGEHGASA